MLDTMRRSLAGQQTEDVYGSLVFLYRPRPGMA